MTRTRLEWARMLRARGQPRDAERARALLDQAVASARAFGLANIERRATELLSSPGIRPTDRFGVAQLLAA